MCSEVICTDVLEGKKVDGDPFEYFLLCSQLALKNASLGVNKEKTKRKRWEAAVALIVS